MELQSEKVDQIAPAFLAAQKSLGSAVRDGENTFLNTTYATLDSVWNAARKPLHDNDIMVLQSGMPIDGEPYLITTFMHISGQFFRGAFPIPSATITTTSNDEKKKKQATETRTDPQSLGTIIKYVRRYALASLMGILDGGDDDAEGAQSQLESEEGSLRRLIINASRNLNPKTFQTTKEGWRKYHKITGAQTGDETQLKDLLKRVNEALKEQELGMTDPFDE